MSSTKRKLLDYVNLLSEEEQELALIALEQIKRRSEFQWNMYGKGVQTSLLFDESVQLRQNWERLFTGAISNEVKKEIHYHEFMWHIYSYGIKPCLLSEEARRTFDQVEKNKLFVMYQRLPYIIQLSSAKDVVAADFVQEQDVYIFDVSFSWTYVITHEEECGPYFATVK